MVDMAVDISQVWGMNSFDSIVRILNRVCPIAGN
jgi:hypothetical protein